MKTVKKNLMRARWNLRSHRSLDATSFGGEGDDGLLSFFRRRLENQNMFNQACDDLKRIAKNQKKNPKEKFSFLFGLSVTRPR